MLDESDPSDGDRMMGFAGMELDTVTGLNLAVMRVQNPVTGRWTSQDPLGFAAGDSNLHRYVNNAPTANNDPEGTGDGPPQGMTPGHNRPRPPKPSPAPSQVHVHHHSRGSPQGGRSSNSSRRSMG